MMNLHPKKVTLISSTQCYNAFSGNQNGWGVSQDVNNYVRIELFIIDLKDPSIKKSRLNFIIYSEIWSVMYSVMPNRVIGFGLMHFRKLQHHMLVVSIQNKTMKNYRIECENESVDVNFLEASFWKAFAHNVVIASKVHHRP